MRIEPIDIRDGRRQRQYQRHGKMETKSGEGHLYDEEWGMRTAPEIREYDNGSRWRRGIMEI